MSFFGKNRTAKSTASFASPDYVKISFAGSGGASSGLANSVRANLQQTIQDLYVVGEPTVYFGVGPSTGSFSIGRYAECGRAFAGLGGEKCGFVQSIQLNPSGGDDCSCGGVAATFSGAILQSVGLDIQAGQTSITETMDFRISDLS